MILSDEILEKELEAFKELVNRTNRGGAPAPVVEQSKKMVSFLSELKRWRSFGKKIEETLNK